MSPTGKNPLQRMIRSTLHAFVCVAMIATGLTTVGLGTAQAAPVGQGFTVTASDLQHILKQIKIAEHHAGLATAANPCAGLLGNGSGPDGIQGTPDDVAQVHSPLIGDGLRTIDGSCNNLQPGQAMFGAADQVFPRLGTASFRPAEDATAFGGPAASSYAQTSGSVVDTKPRVISNLIVDQTSLNPAAVAAAGFPVRTQGNPGVFPCDADGLPVPPATECVPAGETLFIPNVTTDVGLSPPYNSLFTIFGQFFDHGLDKITNGGNGTVFVPLNADDPLIVGADGIAGTPDDPQPGDPKFVPPGQRFMTLTRGKNFDGPGPDGILGTGDDTTHEAINTDSPWVDLSQAFTSHPSHQVFLREYVASAHGPQSTGRLLNNADGSMANWGDVKAQTAALLGIQLVDADVSNIPLIEADPYGNFIPGANGFPQMVTSLGTDNVVGTADDVVLEGNPAAPVSTSGALRINTAFLNDIAHSAAPNNFPDLDTVAGTSLTPADCTGTGSPCYDDELLALHVIAGDGRANENIGLTTIHTIFEREHNRLVGYEQNVLNDPANAALLADFQNTNCGSGCAVNAAGPRTFTYGERLFQAARFVTEMEYQHLVFEEFARKVQPAINPFNLFAFSSTATNPAIKAEFAHAVYRFGHSMLDDTIPRTNVDGTHNDIALLDGFLNPAEFKNVTLGDKIAAGGDPVTGVGADMGSAGAGAIAMGLSDQVGNELDEFVANTLRNNLLGLPLDLPAINMTRARSEGVPTLNNFRKQIFAETNDGQMTPYSDWVDFGMHLKHPESLINFVAAYGHHDNITRESTFLGKREAARMIVDPTVTDPICVGGETTPCVPTDADDFMFSTGAWANVGGVSQTGVDDIDMWVGGLAEMTNLFGGLLGTTFNYVFELQMTQLQDNDRLYYLNRTPGMNLRAQLEGNSFAELIMRNTTATSLKADAFATADCKFELANLTGFGTPGVDAKTGVGSVNDDPASECNENALLTRVNGQIRYRQTNSVDPVGINGQSVYNGTAGPDNVAGGNDNDTFLGNEGRDIIEGKGGDDNSLGGDNNDIITDLAGDDVLKGGPGNDALDGGIGLDLLLGGDGVDLSAGGANTNAHFAGPGDDLIMAGQGADEVDGDSGDDWQEGGEQTDLLQGDSGSLFFDDHNLPGADILIGQSGDDDYDMEGGDDIGVAGPGIEKNAGAAGYDWTIGLGDPQPQDADLALPIVEVLIGVAGVRDRFNETEALSGWNLNDTLRGDDVIPSQVAGGGFIGCDALDQAGLDRIAGLDALVPPLTVDSAPIIAASVTNHCLLVGNVWGEGNILLGGGGSDLIEGRGGDDIIDGDRYLTVRLSVRTDPANPATEIGTTDLLEHMALGGTFGANTTGMTLQQAVFAGLVDPGNIVAVREILIPVVGPVDCGAASPLNCDTALFSDVVANYTITAGPEAGTLTVANTGGGGGGGGVAGNTGTDTVRNVEKLQFADTIIDTAAFFNSPATGAAILSTNTPKVLEPLTVDTTGIADADGLPATLNVQWQAGTVDIPGATGTSFTPTVAQLGSTLRAVVTFTDLAGHAERINSAPTTGPVTNPANSPATGTPALTTTTPQIGSPVVASQGTIDDANGVGPLSFQWQAGTTNITGATSASFTPTASQLNFTLRVVVSFTDGAGNPESVTSASTSAVTVVGPIVTAPVIALSSSTTVTQTRVVTALVSWTGANATAFTLQRSVNGAAFTGVALPTPLTTSISQTLADGSTVQYRVRATDGTTTSAFESSRVSLVDVIDETEASIAYTGLWETQNKGAWLGGTDRYARKAGQRSATLSFSGVSSVAWISNTGPFRGIAQVYLDGVFAGTVDTFSATVRARQVVFSMPVSGAAHTLEVRYTATKNAASGNTRVDVDGFVLLG